MLDLPLIWALILAIGVMLYVILDGFDLGVGTLTSRARSDEERNMMTATVEPVWDGNETCLLYTSPSPRDRTRTRMPSSA